jgi:hypothetical protein
VLGDDAFEVQIAYAAVKRYSLFFQLVNVDGP